MGSQNKGAENDKKYVKHKPGWTRETEKSTILAYTTNFEIVN